MATADQKRTARMMRESAKFGLKGIRLVETNSRLNKIKENQLPGIAKQHCEIQIGISTDRTAVHVGAIFKLDLSYTDSDENEIAITIAATFAIDYVINKPIRSNSIIAEVVQPMAIMMSWPYWREFAQSIATRMGLPAFPIPLMNTSELLKLKPTSKKSET
jgi:hypothetical protein